MYVLAPFSTEERNIYMDNVDQSTVFFSFVCTKEKNTVDWWTLSM